MAKPWADVASSPEFQQLSFDEQQDARHQYFSEVVAPKVPSAHLQDAKSQFDAETGPSASVKGKVNEFINTGGQGIVQGVNNLGNVVSELSAKGKDYLNGNKEATAAYQNSPEYKETQDINTKQGERVAQTNKDIGTANTYFGDVGAGDVANFAGNMIATAPVGGAVGKAIGTGAAAVAGGSAAVRGAGVLTGMYAEGATYGATTPANAPTVDQSLAQTATNANNAGWFNVGLGMVSKVGGKVYDAIAGRTQSGSEARLGKKLASGSAESQQALDDYTATPKDQQPYDLTRAQVTQDPYDAIDQRKTEVTPYKENGQMVHPAVDLAQQQAGNEAKVAQNLTNVQAPNADTDAVANVNAANVAQQQQAIQEPVNQELTKLQETKDSQAKSLTKLENDIANTKVAGNNAVSNANTQVAQAQDRLASAGEDIKNSVVQDTTTKERANAGTASEMAGKAYLDELDKQHLAEQDAYKNIDNDGSRNINGADVAAAADKVFDNGNHLDTPPEIDALMTDKNGRRILDKYRPTQGPDVVTGGNPDNLPSAHGESAPSTSTPAEPEYKDVSVKQMVQDITDLRAINRNAVNDMRNPNNANRGQSAALADQSNKVRQALEQTLNDSNIKSGVERNPDANRSLPVPQGKNPDIDYKTVGEAVRDAKALVATNRENLTRSNNVSRTTSNGQMSNESAIAGTKDSFLGGDYVSPSALGKAALSPDNAASAASNFSKLSAGSGKEYYKQMNLANIADKLGDKPTTAKFDEAFPQEVRKAMLDNGMQGQHNDIMGLRSQLEGAESRAKNAQARADAISADTTKTVAEKEAARDVAKSAADDAIKQQQEAISHAKETAHLNQKALEQSAAFKLNKESPADQVRLIQDNPEYAQHAIDLAKQQNDGGMALRGIGQNVIDDIRKNNIETLRNTQNAKFDGIASGKDFDAAIEKNRSLLEQTVPDQLKDLDAISDIKARLEYVHGAAKPGGREYMSSEPGEQATRGLVVGVAAHSGIPASGANPIMNAVNGLGRNTTNKVLAKANDPYYAKELLDKARNSTPKQFSDWADTQVGILKNEQSRPADILPSQAQLSRAVTKSNTSQQDNSQKAKQKLDNEVNSVYTGTRNGGKANAPAANPNAIGTQSPVSKKNSIDSHTRIVHDAATQASIPAAYLTGLQKAESGGKLNPDIAIPDNRKSSAMGRYQFTEKTWAQMADKHPELNLQPITDANRGTEKDPRVNEKDNTMAAAMYAADNRDAIKSFVHDTLKRPVTIADLHGAHVMGASGFKQFMSAKASAPADSIVPQAAKNNPGLFYSNGKALSVKQVYANFEKTMLNLPDDKYQLASK